MKLWQQVVFALILGTIFGIFLPDYAGYVKPLGTLFLRMIKMVIVPMIFFSLVSGITSMSDPSSLGRVGLKATIAFLATTCCAVLFGLLVAVVMQPGKGVHIDFGQNANKIVQKFYLEEFLIEIIPENIIQAFAENNILQVVFFAIFTGVCINNLGSSVSPIRTFCHSASKLVLRMISIVILLSPYGAFGLISWIVASQGIGAILALSKLVGAVVIAMLIQYGIFGFMIALTCGLSPIPFYKKSLQYQLIALSTSSSKASLATTMEVCKEELGVSDSSASFILPLGAAINMDGLAINLGLTTIFFAQVAGVDLSYADYIMIIITATLGSIGGAGIPGASLIMLPMVLSSVSLPIEGVAILAGIDRILDALRTTINITGDATITLMIDYSEGTFDKEKYYS